MEGAIITRYKHIQKKQQAYVEQHNPLILCKYMYFQFTLCQIEKHYTSAFFQSYFVNNTTFIQVINITDHICIKLEKKEHYPAKVWATGVLPVTGVSCHQCPVTALAVYKSGAPTVQSILYSFSSIIKKYSRELTKNLNINPNQLVYG